MPRWAPRILLVFLLPSVAAVLVFLGVGAVAPGRTGDTIVLACLAATGVAGYLAVRIGRRLERMVAFTRAIAAGEIPARHPAHDGDDFGPLEQSLAEMRDRIAQSVATLEESRERTQGILGAMVEGVVLIGSTGEIMLVNECAARLFELPPGFDYQGRHLVEICRDPELQALVRETLSEGPPPSPRELTVGTGEVRHLSVGIARVGEPGVAPFAFVLVFHDITELKRLETMRRDFVANVSHELRTPLAAIRGYAETLLTGGLGDAKRAREFVAVIERHSERLSRLIDDLLILSDLEFRRIPLKDGDVPVGRLVDDVLELVAAKATRGKVTLCREIPEGLPPLRGDADRLQQVLINLADNAVKYTPAGGRVTIAARTDGGAGQTLEIRVQDTGVGIPAADLPRLTERFYRVDKARSRELGGTGLGLAIVKHIVQAHGGVLDIASTVNVGTTVRVTLPTRPAAAVA
jgi:two-component system, OmpR family, phosphate regulon sensor histidine kinase PhoR